MDAAGQRAAEVQHLQQGGKVLELEQWASNGTPLVTTRSGVPGGEMSDVIRLGL
eukprot:COSAG04_NODE_1520_length_6472_cov_2.157672_3_plen_54_part_00